MIAMVHGHSVHFYVMPENVHGGPNESIECLQRTLKRVEKARGGRLPDILYIQFDNCSREGKNTYMIAYLGWLVHRGVFVKVYVSFHPKGHTHNECDQCASRMCVCLRWVDIMCRCELFKMMRSCYSPRPTVELLDRVANFKRMANPGGKRSCGRGQSHIRRAEGTTQTLLWKIHKAENDRVVVREKQTIEEDQWSTAWSPFHEHSPKMFAKDIPGIVYKEVPKQRLAIVKQTLSTFHELQDEHQRACCAADFDRLSLASDPGAALHWSVQPVS